MKHSARMIVPRTLPINALHDGLSSRLAGTGWIDAALAGRLKRVIGCRNIAVHDDQGLPMPIAIRSTEHPLDDFLQYNRALLLHEAPTGT